MNAAELRELRTTILAQKARQTAALMESAKKLGWVDKLDARDSGVRQTSKSTLLRSLLP